jgi:hypothetical protein
MCSLAASCSEKVWAGKSVYCATEKDVFDALGLMYVPPEQRNVYQHFTHTEEEMRILKRDAQIKGEVEFVPMTLATTPHAGAAASSSLQTATDIALAGPPLKAEVKAELTELEEVERATIGLQRLNEEEAEVLRRQVKNLNLTWK